MHITFTDSAISKLKPLLSGLSGEGALLKLVFDSEGCGCAMNGVPTLWIIAEADDKDLEAKAEPFRVVYSPKHEVFFEDHMKIDYQAESKAYILKSNNQIYNANLNVIDKQTDDAHVT
ncbi:iron-sulfur cluster biosynthesis family protein [Paenibacillus eucommiae]|uniref:Uncharacterized protein YqkB n=1 Tax=Paenibacillus eucommiae TaxID=1355755 RepID=A0ABS4J6L0_9BACL|nr:iron-sulfur cluster biosynthesis family protein [Paenibacillus eucommiae]MBP1995496.1 uncharacterized protein YqkB [Paenibacillus eucommiae]